MARMLLTTVTPVYQGVLFLEDLVSEIERLRARLDAQEAPIALAEAIFVDDSSRDGSAELLERLAARHPWIRTVSLSRNYGQHPATVAGILHSSGDWVVTLDEDLQHRPHLAIDLLARAVEDGRDLVYAAPQGAVHQGRFRDGSSRLFKWLVASFAGNPDIVRFNSFRLIRGSIARAAASVASHETYLDMALAWFTDRVAAVSLPLREVREVTDSRSGYGLRSLLRHGRRMLVSSQIKPLRLGGLIGFLALAVSAAGIVLTLVIKIVSPEMIQIRGWTSLILVGMFFGGLITLLLGISLEYLSDLHLQALGRPAFFVSDRSGDRAIAEWIRRTQ